MGFQYTADITPFLEALQSTRDYYKRKQTQDFMRKQGIPSHRPTPTPPPPPQQRPPAVDMFEHVVREVVRRDMADGGDRPRPLGQHPGTASGTKRAREMANAFQQKAADPSSQGAMLQRGREEENTRREEATEAGVRHVRSRVATSAAPATPIVDDQMGWSPGQSRG